MVAKVAGGILGLGLISTGSIAFAKPEWLGLNKEIPWTPLSQDKDFTGDTTKSTYDNKFGSTYKNYLVGATSNEDWWKESFERLKKETPTSKKFKYAVEANDNAVKSGFDSSSSNALNQICKVAYKSDSDKVKETPGESNNDEYKEEDVWKYCSYIGEKPKTVSGEISEENDYPTPAGSTGNTIGKDKKTDLLSIKNGNNSKLWKLKNDEFFGRGVFGSAKEPTDEFFKALFKTKSTNKDALKNKCLVAYGLTSANTATTAQPKAEDVVKYCSAKSIN